MSAREWLWRSITRERNPDALHLIRYQDRRALCGAKIIHLRDEETAVLRCWLCEERAVEKGIET